MNDLLKEAIADAKAVRETALANAKLALEEAFTPRLQSMLSAKLSEEEGMEDEPVAEDEMPMDEPAMEEPAPEEPVAAEGRGMMDADEDPTDVHSEEMEAPADEEPVSEEDMAADAELEEILRELEDEGEEAMTETEGDEEAVEEQSDSSDIGKGDNKLDYADSKDEDDPGKGDLTKGHIGENEESEDVDLEEIIKALKEEEGDDEPVSEEGRGEKEVDETEGEEAKADLEEAYNVIRFLKGKINEVNLLNAKLLFSNKLFRNHNLNEGQKMKVIENFDRAQSLREVKLVFATLSESFRFGRKKKTIKESYASKATRSTKPNRKVISEGNTLADRWKKLANLV